MEREVPDLKRPRLADAVVVRRHVVDGQEMLVLRDAERGTVLHLDERAWGLLSQCDGERDVHAAASAARKDGIFEHPGELLGLLEELAPLGVLTDGPKAEIPSASTPADRPLERLPGFTLRCDGSGSCCRIYGGVAFLPEESDLARSLGPAAIPWSRAFTPLVSGIKTKARSIALVNDRCLLLEDDGRCSVHRRAGPAAKPLGCKLFPATIVDDGVALRVTPSMECKCELESVGVRDGDALAGAALTRSDLRPALVVPVLPETVQLGAGRAAPRAALRAWTAGLVGELPEGDAAQLAWGLARRVEADGLEPAGSVMELGKGPTLAEIRPRLDTMLDRLREVAPIYTTWRSPSSLARRALEWVLAAAERVDETALEPRVDERERLFLRAALFGYLGVAAGRPLDETLEDLALRMVVARTMLAAPPDDPDPALRQPLALLNAVLRNHLLVR